MHFPVEKIIVNTIDFTDLVFLATSVHVIPLHPFTPDHLIVLILKL